MALILIVDDDVNFRALLENAVSEMGHQAIAVSNGAEGLVCAKAEHPHLIVTDIIMPEMDGVEFNALLRMSPETKDIPVLMLTGSLDKHMEVSTQFASSLSFEYIVGKSAPVQRIVDMVSEILAKYYQL